ncbi:MAG: hypothetical protein JRN20_01815 [Nitrososphaerota archaeon]|nr:hypothetical protein [Nitrososphaerota archaeon]
MASKLFSRQIKEDQNFLIGKSFLFEIDSSSPYEKSVSDFVEEVTSDGCSVLVFTHKSSPVYKILSSNHALRFFLSSSTVSYPKQTYQQNEILVPQNDFPILLDLMSRNVTNSSGSPIGFIIDSISDMLISSGFDGTYKFLKSSSEILGGANVTSLFLLTRGIHDTKILSTVRSLFSIHLVSGPDATVKLTRK